MIRSAAKNYKDVAVIVDVKLFYDNRKIKKQFSNFRR